MRPTPALIPRWMAYVKPRPVGWTFDAIGNTYFYTRPDGTRFETEVQETPVDSSVTSVSSSSSAPAPTTGASVESKMTQMKTGEEAIAMKQAEGQKHVRSSWSTNLKTREHIRPIQSSLATAGTTNLNLRTWQYNSKVKSTIPIKQSNSVKNPDYTPPWHWRLSSGTSSEVSNPSIASTMTSRPKVTYRTTSTSRSGMRVRSKLRSSSSVKNNDEAKKSTPTPTSTSTVPPPTVAWNDHLRMI